MISKLRLKGLRANPAGLAGMTAMESWALLALAAAWLAAETAQRLFL